MKQLLIFSLLLQTFSVYANEKFIRKVPIPKGFENISIEIKTETDSIGNLITTRSASLQIVKHDTILLNELICIKAEPADIFLTANSSEQNSLRVKRSPLPFADVISNKLS